MDHSLPCAVSLQNSPALFSERGNIKNLTQQSLSRCPSPAATRVFKPTTIPRQGSKAANIRRRHQAVSEAAVRHLTRSGSTWHRSSGRTGGFPCYTGPYRRRPPNILLDSSGRLELFCFWSCGIRTAAAGDLGPGAWATLCPLWQLLVRLRISLSRRRGYLAVLSDLRLNVEGTGSSRAAWAMMKVVHRGMLLKTVERSPSHLSGFLPCSCPSFER